MNIALLGDSTLDNRAYTAGGPDVRAHLERLLAGSGHATLLAVDGAMIADVRGQLERLRDAAPADRPFSHLVLSVGGNDLLAEVDVLGQAAESVAQALVLVRERSEDFGRRYRSLLDEVLQVALPTVVCTVYNGAFPDPVESAAIETAMRVFDHEILAAAADRDVPVVDLRRVCDDADDYWNPIEPNERGGAKIAAALLEGIRRV
jgi:lysophospholipase L1-like esterase